MEQPSEQSINKEYVEWQTSVRLDRHKISPRNITPPGAPAESLDHLFAAEGDGFLLLAFKTFLDREPNEQELHAGRQDLEKGISKSVVAARIRYSPEARKRPQKLNLRKAYWTDRLSSTSLIGPVATLCFGILSIGNLKRSILSQRNTLLNLNEELGLIREQLSVARALNTDMIRDIVRGEERQKLTSEATTKVIGDLARTLEQEARYLRDRQFDFEQALSTLSPSSAEDGLINQGTPVDENFYIAFEDYFRGSEDTIRERLRYYLPVVEERLPPAIRHLPCVDIGCGRGEWIALLGETGYQAKGLDLNEKNVSACREKGLDATFADGIQWLRQTESQSLAMVTSFHVIEHLSLPQLHAMVIETFRCLAPGGLLLFETPNPENLVTAANRFYTDPSHRHPLPPDLMEFLLKYKGFRRMEIHRLHPSDAEQQFTGDSEIASRLNHLLYGPQDYAVLAMKP